MPRRSRKTLSENHVRRLHAKFQTAHPTKNGVKTALSQLTLACITGETYIELAIVRAETNEARAFDKLPK
jgi:hypothetical protein